MHTIPIMLNLCIPGSSLKKSVLLYKHLALKDFCTISGDVIMTNIAPLLAWRYLRQTAHEPGSSTMIKIVFLSIAIGSFALALVTAIMHGFEVVVHEKMQGIHAQLAIRSTENPIDMDRLTPVLEKEFPQITAISPSAEEHILLQPTNQENVAVMVIMGIDPERHKNTSTLHKKIIGTQGLPITLERALAHNQIIIGASLARAYALNVGDTVNLFYSQDLSANARKISMDSNTAIIGGIYDTGIDDFDANIVFCSLDFLYSLFPNAGISQVQLRLAPGTNAATLSTELKDRLELDVVSWKDLYKPLVEALTLEKYVMFLILALITLVASMNIISLLFMQITKKRPDIAILTVIGCTPQTIQYIFIGMSLLISGIACLCGLLCAWFTSGLLEAYPCIQLPDVYYVTHLPAKMTFSILATVFGMVMLLCLLSTWIATRVLRNFSIAHVLRFEG